MAAELDADVRAAQRTARRLARMVAPMASEADNSLEVHKQMRKALAESGLCGLLVRRADGGAVESVDPLTIAVVREALMGCSAHLDGLFAMQGIGSFALSMAGSDELKAEWLPKVASLECLAALALTEPDTGSDLRNITTTITPEGDNLRINGRKAFITNGADAGYILVFGKEGETYSLVLVPATTPGVTTRRGPAIIAPHLVGEVDFDDVVVPASHRLGAPGSGFKLALSTLATFRVSVAGAATGLAQAALDTAVEHTKERTQFGKPLIKLGAVANLLARAWVDVESARSITYRAAARVRMNPLASLHMSSIAKVAATEAADRVVDSCVQVMGRFGLIQGSDIERMYRNARPMRIYEGATEVILDSLAKQLQQGCHRPMDEEDTHR